MCGGEMDSERVIGIQGNCTSGYSVIVISKNGKLQLSNDHLHVNECGGILARTQIDINQVCITVSEHVLVVMGIQENRCAAYKRLD